MRQQATFAAGGLPQDIRFTADDDVEPVRNGPLARDHATLRKRGWHQMLGHLLALVLVKRREQLDAGKGAHATLQFALPDGFTVRVAFLDEMHHLIRQCHTPAIALDRCQQVSAHRRIGGIVVARFEQPIAQRVAYRPWRELHRHA